MRSARDEPVTQLPVYPQMDAQCYLFLCIFPQNLFLYYWQHPEKKLIGFDQGTLNGYIFFFFQLIISLKFFNFTQLPSETLKLEDSRLWSNTVSALTALGMLSAPAHRGADFISSCCFSSSQLWFLSSDGRPIFDMHSRVHGMLPLSHTLLPPSHSYFLMRMYPCYIPVTSISHHLKYIREKKSALYSQAVLYGYILGSPEMLYKDTHELAV